jgi:soluble lytic murein transglycosylase-like protein
MLSNIITARTPATLPRLAATAIICWSLGANTHVDAANTSPALQGVSQHTARTALPAVQDMEDSLPALHVLSDKDADLYRAIFAAQDKGDWKAADKLIAKLGNRRLVGHVLAARYESRSPSAKDLQVWLERYADQPQAGELYERALSLAAKGSRIPAPASAEAWTGNDGYGASFGFKASSNASSIAAKRFGAKIARALRHDEPITAENLLATEQKSRKMPEDEIANAQALIAANYFYDGQSQHARYLADEIAESHNPLGLWIGGLTAWQQDDAEASAAAFAELASLPGLSAWDQTAASFWAARAYKRAGDQADATRWLHQAALKPHSFYGYLAAHLLGQDVNWSWQLPPLDEKHIGILTAEKGGWRALALLQIGQKDLAESELRHVNPQGRRDLQESMLALAEAAHMPSLALQLGGVATHTDGKPYDAALYPLPPWQPTAGFDIDPALLYALMRRESQFDPSAVSERGACGLMQLMPATAQIVERASGSHEKIGRACNARLLNPGINMALGQKYVRQLAAQPMIGDNLVLLLAAYNGGPGNLARWIRDSNELQTRIANDEGRNSVKQPDPLMFLESMPAHQTRDYVEQVLMHYWSYRARLAEPETSLTQLAHGEWPRYAIDEVRRPTAKDAALPGDGNLEFASTIQ